MEPTYIHLQAGAALPECRLKPPFAAVVIVASSVSNEWRDEVSRWLVDNGCLYMMAWGDSCSSWDDSVDHANIETFEFGEIPDAAFVITTWHDEPLEEVLWFATHTANHPVADLSHLMLLDISYEERSSFILDELSRSSDLHVN